MEFDEKIISMRKRLNKCFKKINFNLLPKQLLEMKERSNTNDVIFLIKVIDFIKYYEDFEKTYINNTSTDILIMDINDLYAYMLMNSSVQIAINDAIEFSIILIKSRGNTARVEAEKEEILYEYKHGLRKIKEDFEEARTKCEKINMFRNSYEKELDEYFIYVDENFEKSRVKLISLFNNLSFEEKYLTSLIFINDMDTDMEKRSANMNIFRCVFSGGRYAVTPKIMRKHPMLMLLDKSDINIIKSVFSEFPNLVETDINKRLDICAKFHSNKNYLKEKCFSTLQTTQKDIKKLLENYFTVITRS